MQLPMYCRPGLKRLFLLLIAAAMLGGCARQVPVPQFAAQLSPEQCYSSYVLLDPRFEGNNHSAWGIPVEIVRGYPELFGSLQLDPAWDYVVFERGEYAWWFLQNHNRFRALFLPSDSVVAIGGFSSAQRNFLTETQYALQLTGEEMHLLLEYLYFSIAQDEQGQWISLPAAEGEKRKAFAGAQPYNLTNICFSWTANALNYRNGPLEMLSPVWNREDMLAELRRVHGPQRVCPIPQALPLQ